MASNSDHSENQPKSIFERRIRSFMRRQGRLSPGQENALYQHWQTFGLEPQTTLYNFTEIFKNNAEVYLEIGFGMGDSLIKQAIKNPQINFLGIEVHKPGVGKVLSEIQAHQLTNIRLICADAVEILKQNIPDGSLAAVQIFFPDPWPKRRHHKRRLIQEPFIDLLLSKLNSNGYIHLATDWKDYADHMLKILSDFSTLQNKTTDPQFMPKIQNRPHTKFEQRGTKLGYGIWDFIFVKEN